MCLRWQFPQCLSAPTTSSLLRFWQPWMEDRIVRTGLNATGGPLGSLLMKWLMPGHHFLKALPLKQLTTSLIIRYKIISDDMSLVVHFFNWIRILNIFELSLYCIDRVLYVICGFYLFQQRFLKFPEEPRASKQLVDLLQKLLCGAKERLGFQGLRCHSFFSSVEWNNLRQGENIFLPANFPLFSLKVLSITQAGNVLL